MVMQRDEQEVFDDAIHVFFEKEYYDDYVSKATKYSSHRYAYHEDKLGEVVNQIFEENIGGLVLHLNIDADISKKTIGEEKYISAHDLLGLKDAADSYHYTYMTSIDRCSVEDTVARLWTKYVYIIGQIPDLRTKPKEGEKRIFELVTMKRKSDGSQATAEDYDYESLKIFLTADSAMRFNKDKRPVSKYKLSMLSQLVKGKFRVIIEPHRSYWLEYDPATLDLTGHLEIPQYTEETVKARIVEFTKMQEVFTILAPAHSDYKNVVGNPYFMRPDENNVIMYLFEKYDDAALYVLQNPTVLPILDGIFPIGKVDNLETLILLASKLGVTIVDLDTNTLGGLGCKMDFFKAAAGYTRELEEIMDKDGLSLVVKTDEDGTKHYRIPAIKFYNCENEYLVSDERKAELAAHIDNDADNGLIYTSQCSIADMMVMLRETAVRFEDARKAEDEENKTKYNRLMNLITVPLTEALCEKTFIFTLRDDNGDLMVKNNIAYLIVTNRYEIGRKSEGRLAPAGVENESFINKLCETAPVAAVTDGPNLLCLVDTKLVAEVSKQWRKSEAIREEIIIYLTQGLDLSYADALYYYKKLKNDGAIFVEFMATIKEGAYPPVGMVNIEGHTAKELADTYGFDVLGSYDALISLKADKDYLSKFDKAQENNDNDTSESSTDETKTAKKGFFGKLFKK
jgi:hypothetical protein